MMLEVLTTKKFGFAYNGSFGNFISFWNIKQVCTALVLIILASGKIHSQWLDDPTIDQRVQHGINQIYNFEFDKAEATFTEVINLRPDHPVGFFFRAMIQWERIITNFDDESQDEKLYELLDVVIDMCEKRLDENPKDVTAMFFKGGAIGFRGRLRANRGKWLGAANDGIVALPLVRKAFELEPNNYDVLLGIGIYNYYAAVIPDKYPIVKPVMLFFPSGDRKKGLEQLKQASLHAKYAKVESMYFLMQNYSSYEKDYVNALDLARTLYSNYPNNSLFHRYLGRCLISSGYVGEANEIFIEIFKRYSRKQIGYDLYDIREASYYIGNFEFSAGRLDSALHNLYKCDETCRKLDKDEPSGFMVLANLIIGKIYDLQNKRQYAIRQYKKVLAIKEYDNSHKEANKYIEKPFVRFK
jgi:hypothetical protein